jgi:hypothetical protein
MAGRDDLQFLAMFHFAIGAMAALVSLVPALGLFVSTSLAAPGEPVDMILVRLFGEGGAAVAAGLLLVLGMTLGGLLVAEGFHLMRLKGYRFCRFVSTLGLFFVPFGTALGAVTLAALSRPATREQFDR